MGSSLPSEFGLPTIHVAGVKAGLFCFLQPRPFRERKNEARTSRTHVARCLAPPTVPGALLVRVLRLRRFSSVLASIKPFGVAPGEPAAWNKSARVTAECRNSSVLFCVSDLRLSKTALARQLTAEGRRRAL